MAKNFLIQLSGAKGFGKVVYCSGLGIDASIYPSADMLGDPFLSRQPFYFLSQLEYAAHFRVETGDVPDGLAGGENLDGLCGTLLDSYLFELSCLDQDSFITSKTRQWHLTNVGEPSEDYEIDGGNALTPVVDVLNDDTVLDCYDVESGPPGCFNSWLLIEEYFDDAYAEYVKSLQGLLPKSVHITRRQKNRTTEEERPLLRLQSPLLSYRDLQQLDSLCSPDRLPRAIPDGCLNLSRSTGESLDVPVIGLKCDRIYSRYLLCFYFAGLKADTPTDAFKQFYNILEYFFEDATLIEMRATCPDKTAAKLHVWDDIQRYKKEIRAAIGGNLRPFSERAMTRHVLTRLLSRDEFLQCFNDLPEHVRDYLTHFDFKSGSIEIAPLDPNSTDAASDYANRLYTIRCGVVHSKKEHFRSSGCFLPFSYDEHLIEMETTFLRRLVQYLIKQEPRLLVGQPIEVGGAARLLTIEQSWKARDYTAAFEEMPRVLLYASQQDENTTRTYTEFYAAKTLAMLDLERMEPSFEPSRFVQLLGGTAVLLTRSKDMQAFLAAAILLLQGQVRAALDMAYSHLPQSLRARVGQLMTSLQPEYLQRLLKASGVLATNPYAVLTGEITNTGGDAYPTVMVVAKKGEETKWALLSDLEDAVSEGKSPGLALYAHRTTRITGVVASDSWSQ